MAMIHAGPVPIHDHNIKRITLSTGINTVKIIQVKVKPGARISGLEETSPGIWLAQLKSQPVDGKANEELLVLVARHFGCRQSSVSIKSGASGRMKLVRIDSS
jgi:uncharacterized protein YggU (UPF0235/DUF167 family)